MGRGDVQNIRIVAVMDNDNRKLCWLRRIGHDLYGNLSGLGFKYSRHESGEFHPKPEGGSDEQKLSVAILTTAWTRHNLSQQDLPLRELFQQVLPFNLREERGDYPQFTCKKGYDRVVEIDCAEVDTLCLNIWLVDRHSVESLRLVEDQTNSDWRRLHSEKIETGKEWLLLVEAYDMTAPLPPLREEELPPFNYTEADKARLLGKIRFREYLAIRNRELGLKS